MSPQKKCEKLRLIDVLDAFFLPKVVGCGGLKQILLVS